MGAARHRPLRLQGEARRGAARAPAPTRLPEAQSGRCFPLGRGGAGPQASLGPALAARMGRCLWTRRCGEEQLWAWLGVLCARRPQEAHRLPGDGSTVVTGSQGVCRAGVTLGLAGDPPGGTWEEIAYAHMGT